MSRQSFGERINRYLAEEPGQVFSRNKWRFWFVALIGFQLLNASLTAVVFASGGNLQRYMGAILLGVGALLAWLGVAFLHYSDARDRRLARGVSALDSITLICVVAHFCFLLWIYGHVSTLQIAEADYKVRAEAYNERAERIARSNEAIAEAARQIAEAEKSRAKIENDTAYQIRKAAERGAQVGPRAGGGSAGSGLATAPVELERPERPAESSTAFLTRWDLWIRLANFGELVLAAITLIYIRNRSAKTNAPAADDEFPSELPDDFAKLRNSDRARFEQTAKSDNRRLSPDRAISTDRRDALKLLRAHLKEIAFYCPGYWFRADLIEGGVVIRMFRRRQGLEETVATTRQSNRIFGAIARPDFRSLLVAELRRQDFPIGDIPLDPPA